MYAAKAVAGFADMVQLISFLISLVGIFATLGWEVSCVTIFKIFSSLVPEVSDTNRGMDFWEH